jgi:16S rRNA (uracil1498-N3)-methyltransferase
MPDGVADLPRLFVETELGASSSSLEPRHAHYVVDVLRLKPGDRLIVFNGRGDERCAIIETADRRGASLRLQDRITPLPEPDLAITLVQSLVKNDAMDLIVQKATELGVRNICAVKTDFSVVRLDETRGARRLEHWRKIAASACEQSGRHFPPALGLYHSLGACFANLPENALRVAFHPGAHGRLGALEPASADVCVLVGPEGGWSAADLESIAAAGFASAGLGPRTLRAETAALTVCALAQSRWGDLG